MVVRVIVVAPLGSLWPLRYIPTPAADGKQTTFDVRNYLGLMNTFIRQKTDRQIKTVTQLQLKYTHYLGLDLKQLFIGSNYTIVRI